MDLGCEGQVAQAVDFLAAAARGVCLAKSQVRRTGEEKQLKKSKNSQGCCLELLYYILDRLGFTFRSSFGLASI